VAAAGPDLHLAAPDGVVVLDTRLMRGWELVPAASGDISFPVRDFEAPADHRQDGLF
jgi:hypothetical protein